MQNMLVPCVQANLCSSTCHGWHMHAMQRVACGSQGLRRLHAHVRAQALGASVLTELRRQRDTLQHAKGTLEEVDGTIDKGNASLKAMNRRAKPFFFF